MTIRAIAVVLAGAAAVLLAPGQAGAAQAKQAGSLDQVTGRAGCHYDPKGGSDRGIRVNVPGRCARAAGLDGAYEVAASADGRHVYVASFTGDALSVFARDAKTGHLRQLDGSAGCAVEDPFDVVCASAVGLDGPSGLALSPDGRHLYVASYMTHGVATFARNRASGALAQLGCISEGVNETDCERGTGLFGAGAVAVSPEGRNVYVASFWSDGLAVFSRDAATGALTQLAGAAGCVRDPTYADPGDTRCTPAIGLEGPAALVVSADGRNVYVGAFGAGALAVLARDRATGALAPLPAAAACWSEDAKLRGCTEGRGLDGAFSVAASRDGKHVYVATGFDRRDPTGTAPFAASGVAMFARAPNGALRQLAGKAGCVNEVGKKGCADGRALQGAQSIVLSPDGRNAYVAAAASDAIAIFSRDARTGRLAQLPGRGGCVSDTGTGGLCRVATGLGGASAVAFSPDGRYAYAPGFYSSAIVVFTRTPAPRSGR